MPSIAGYTFSIMNMSPGLLNDARQTEEIQRPGSDGIDRRTVGFRPTSGSIRTVSAYDSAATRNTFKDNFTALVGGYAVIVDPVGISRTVFIESFRVTREFVGRGTIGLNVGGNFALECQWEVRSS